MSLNRPQGIFALGKSTVILTIVVLMAASLASTASGVTDAGGDRGAADDRDVMSLHGSLSFVREDVHVTRACGEDTFSMAGALMSFEPGTYALPELPAPFIVPADGEVLSWEIIGSDPVLLGTGLNLHVNGELLPVSSPAVPTGPADPGPVDYDPEIGYLAGGGWTRDFHMAELVVRPLVFDPVDSSISLYRRIDIRLDVLTSEDLPTQDDTRGWEGWSSYAGDPFLRSVTSRAMNPQHAQAFRAGDMAGALAISEGLAAGADVTPAGPTLADGQYTYALITNAALQPTLKDLADWKTRKGIRTKVVDISWIYSQYSGNNPAKVRSFITDAVAQWNVTYVLLGGDTSVVPHRGCYGKVGGYTDNSIPADLYYMGLTGDWNADADAIYGEIADNVDLYPDVYAARFPVDTVAQAENMVDKVLTYETEPPLDYELEMLFMAEYLDANTNGGLAKDLINTTYVPSRFNITRLYEATGNLNDGTVDTEVSRGKGISNHVGHCNWNVMGIGSSSLSIAEVQGFSNGERVGVIYSIGCIANSFERNDCIAENWLLNTIGGAVVFNGNSRYGWYSPGNPGGGPSDQYDQSYFNSLFSLDIFNAGATLATSKEAFAPYAASLGAARWIQFCMNIIGDPEMPIWTDTPQNLSVTHPAQAYYGLYSVPVQVKDEGGNPLDNALVCVMGSGSGTAYGTAVTDSNGWAHVPVNIDTMDPLNVTATRHNYLPYEGVMTITTDSSNPTIQVNDDDYGWFSDDPGGVIDVDFNGTGETDIAWAQYQLGSGGWNYIIDQTGHVPVLDWEWNVSAVYASLPDGVSTFSVRCEDGAGNPASEADAFVVRKDTAPPGITVNSPTFGWYTSDPGDVIDVDFSNMSTGSPLRNASWNMGYPYLTWYEIFNSPVADYTTDWSLPWEMMYEGPTVISIDLYDGAGNRDETADQITFLKDTYAPYVNYLNDTYGWYSSDPGDVIDVDFSNGGNGSLLDKAQYKVGSGGWYDIFTTDSAGYSADWGVDWAQLAEGENTVSIRTLDVAGLEDETNDAITIKKDTTPPRVTLNGKVFGWYTENPGACIDVDFSNGGAGSLLAEAQYNVIGGPGNKGWVDITAESQGDYTDDWAIPWYDLAEGNNTVEVRVFDEAGNEDDTWDTIYVLKDTVNPEVVVNGPEYGWWTEDPGEVVDVDFQNGGGGSSLDFAAYKVGALGEWSNIFEDDVPNYYMNWSVNFSALDEGDNTVYIAVVDGAGHEDTTNDIIHIAKDVTPPSMLYDSPEFGWFFEDPGKAMDVDFTNGGTGSLLTGAQFRVVNVTDWVDIFSDDLAQYTGNWAVPWAELAEGESLVEVRTFDEAGWEDNTTDVLKFLKDTTPPEITVNKLNYGWYGGDPGPVIDVDFDDGGGGAPVVKAQYQFENTDDWHTVFELDNGTAAYTDDWAIDWEAAPEGVRMVYIRLFDAAGQEDETYDYIVFMRDTKAPLIDVNSDRYGWYEMDPGSVVDVDFITGGMGSPLSFAVCWVDAGEDAEGSGGRSGVVGTRAEPELAPVPEAAPVIFETPEGELGPANFKDNWGVEFDSVPEGVNTVLIHAEDMGGNAAQGRITFKKDTLPPERSVLHSPADGDGTAKTRPPLVWLEGFDDGSGVAGYTLQVSRDQMFAEPVIELETGETTHTPEQSLPLGVYYWRVSASDAFDHRGEWSDTWSFEVESGDTAGVNDPPVADAGPDQTVNAGQTVRFDGTGSYDPEGRALQYMWDFGGGESEAGSATAFAFTEAGEYTVTLTVTDDGGLESSDTLTVTVMAVTGDTDGDGISDTWELDHGLDPNDPEDGEEDIDGDGYTNKDEFDAGTHPGNNADSPLWSKVEPSGKDGPEGTEPSLLDPSGLGSGSDDKQGLFEDQFFLFLLFVIIISIIAISAGVAGQAARRKKERKEMARLREERAQRAAAQRALMEAEDRKRIAEAQSMSQYPEDLYGEGVLGGDGLSFTTPAMAAAVGREALPAPAASKRPRPPQGRRGKPVKARLARPPKKPVREPEPADDDDDDLLEFEEEAGESADEAGTLPEEDLDEELEFEDEVAAAEEEGELEDEVEFVEDTAAAGEGGELDDEVEFEDGAGEDELLADLDGGGGGAELEYEDDDELEFE